MKTYIKPRDLKIQNLEDEFLISKGVLHIHSLSIDKKESSKEFNQAFSDFISDGQITVNEKSELNADFNQLAQLNLIDLKLDASPDITIIVEDEGADLIKQFFPEVTSILRISDFFSQDQINLLNNSSDTIALNSLKEVYTQKFKNSQFYFISSYAHLSAIRAFNKLTKIIDKQYTLGFYDNKNLFFTRVVHGETGCYECLEKQMIAKFSGVMDDYIGGIGENFDLSMYGFIVSILKNEIKFTQLYGDSMLVGNVLHFYLPTYEYNFNFNKRQTSCTTCATVNNILFSEQNMKSSNILKRILSE